MKLTKRKGFNFFRSYFDVYNELESDSDKVAFIDALLDRQFLGVKPQDLSGLAKFAYISQTNSIDSQVKGYEDKTGVKLNTPTAPPTAPPSYGGTEPPTVQVQVEVQEKEKEQLTLYSESHFLIDWNKCRVHYLKKPSNINKLKTMERSDFNRATSEFSGEEIKNALHGLFKQEVINFDSMVLRPKHFLERVTDYLDAHNTKSYKMYGSKPKEIQY